MPINPELFKVDPDNFKDDPHLHELAHKYNAGHDKIASSVNEIRGKTAEEVLIMAEIAGNARKFGFWAREHLRLNMLTITILTYCLTEIFNRIGINTKFIPVVIDFFANLIQHAG